MEGDAAGAQAPAPLCMLLVPPAVGQRQAGAAPLAASAPRVLGRVEMAMQLRLGWLHGSLCLLGTPGVHLQPRGGDVPLGPFAPLSGAHSCSCGVGSYFKGELAGWA